MPSRNILFNYLYRDASNFKLFGGVVFSNPNNLSLEEIKRRIESRLIDGMYFDPDEWGVPRLRFEDFDEDLDHGWCEFDECTPCPMSPIFQKECRWSSV